MRRCGSILQNIFLFMKVLALIFFRNAHFLFILEYASNFKRFIVNCLGPVLVSYQPLWYVFVHQSLTILSMF